MNSNLQRDRDGKENVWEGELVPGTARPLVVDIKARMPGLVEGQRRVLREGRCLSNGAFPKGDSPLCLESDFLFFMWETLIVFPRMPWWSPNSCFNLVFSGGREIGSSFSPMENFSTL
jgi:hypothetical protein